MALHANFPDDPHAILDPAIRWFPADETLCESGADRGAYFSPEYSAGNPFTIFTVSTLTRTTCPTNLTMYSSSSGLFGSLVIPLRLSVFMRYWSITQSSALRLIQSARTR